MNSIYQFSGYALKQEWWLARLDSRTRIVVMLVLALLISITSNYLVFGVLSFVLIGMVLSLRIGWQPLRGLLFPVLLMMLITFVLHILFDRPESVVAFKLLGRPIMRGAIILGLIYGWKIALFVFAGLVLSRIISPEEFGDSVVRLSKPLISLGIPIYDIGMALMIAFRFIPSIFTHYQGVRFAQMARGAEFGGHPLTRVKKAVPLLVPVTAISIRKSDVLASALIVRGWGVSSRRTRYRAGRIRTVDVVALLATGALAVFALSVSF